jgi:hypothetical protein
VYSVELISIYIDSHQIAGTHITPVNSLWVDEEDILTLTSWQGKAEVVADSFIQSKFRRQP